jgi:hypothetical protein
MSDRGAGRYLSQSLNASPREVFPLKYLSYKNMSSAATEQATLDLLSVSSALGIKSSSSFFFFLMLFVLLSFLSTASLVLVREALSLKGGCKAQALVDCSITLGGVLGQSILSLSQCSVRLSLK